MGWIKLNRQIVDHWVWQEKPFSRGQAWLDLLLLANHQNGEIVHRGKIKATQRGTVYRSVYFLADRWGWSRHKVADFLDALERDSMILQKRTPLETEIFLVNYEKFQGARQKKGQQKDSKKDSAGTHTRKNTTYSKENIKEGALHTDAETSGAAPEKSIYERMRE